MTRQGPQLVLVCGSRDWHRGDLIAGRLTQLPRGSTVMHGACRGADVLAGTIATRLGFAVEEYPAAWREHGKRAGMLRNLAMLDRQPDLVIAFWRHASTGTGHVVHEALRRGIAVDVIAA